MTACVTTCGFGQKASLFKVELRHSHYNDSSLISSVHEYGKAHARGATLLLTLQRLRGDDNLHTGVEGMWL